MPDGSDEKPEALKVVELVPKQSDFEKALAHAKSNMDTSIALQQQLAKLRRAAYLSYVAEGFTEQQAMELCKN